MLPAMQMVLQVISLLQVQVLEVQVVGVIKQPRNFLQFNQLMEVPGGGQPAEVYSLRLAPNLRR